MRKESKIIGLLRVRSIHQSLQNNLSSGFLKNLTSLSVVLTLIAFIKVRVFYECYFLKERIASPKEHDSLNQTVTRHFLAKECIVLGVHGMLN